jgi:transposase, IS30 family
MTEINFLIDSLGMSSIMAAQGAWDQISGSSLALHSQLTRNTDIAVRVRHPQSPWQRGSNESTNVLVHPYLHKATDLTEYSQFQLEFMAHEINIRPRKGLGLRSPLAFYRELLFNNLLRSFLVH